MRKTGITTGTDHLCILVITGVGDVDTHTIILTTIIGTAITPVAARAKESVSKLVILILNTFLVFQTMPNHYSLAFKTK